MGYLTVKGKLMTYNEYKHLIEKYKHRGLLEFLDIYNAHKDKHRERRDLHWGEELEYTLFHFDEKNNKVQLSNSAFDLI
jgi:ribosomal protein S1